MDWGSVTLVDRPGSAAALHDVEWDPAGAPDLALIDVDGLRGLRGRVDISSPETVVCLAIPTSELADVARALEPVLHPSAILTETGAAKVAAQSILHPIVGRRYAFGMRPLFDTVRSLDGQTIVLTHDDADDPRLGWFVTAVENHGGIVKHATADEHDTAMARIQTMLQQCLLGFADALLASDLDLEHDLWEMRTPAFETLLGLTARTLSEHQQRAIAAAQATPAARAVGDELAAAHGRLLATLRDADPDTVGAHITRLRDRFSGSLFETVHATATAVVGAAQAKREELSRHRREGIPVGLTTHDRPDDLRVGTIAHLSPTEVVIDEALVGACGEAFLLVGEGVRNARKHGVSGKPRRTRFAMGRTDVLTGPTLDARLDDWLAHVDRDIRFLVPESVAGEGIVHVISQVPRVRGPQVVSEVVRTGQRAVVIRVQIRADADVEATIEDLRARVGDAYAWPAGLSLPRSGDRRATIAYLGPPGTFSETGARHCATSLGIDTDTLEPHASFERVLAAIADGAIGVLPICSSASGLVERAASALLDCDGAVEAGGVVDVPVRFDAYVREGLHLEDLRGATVVSHPQVLLQCRRFIERWRLRPEEAPSTAEAGRIALQRDEPVVALAGAGLGSSGGLRVAESEVDDLSGSLTRFVVIGSRGTFGQLTGGSDPTLRTLWIGRTASCLTPVIDHGGAAFDEFISGPSGRVLLVTSRVFDGAVPPGTITLGRLPWTPRTPLVRLEG